MTPRGRGLRAERREPDLDEAKALIRKLQQEDANLRRALRSAGPRASERINVEIEAVAAELAAAHARIAEPDQAERPLPITTKLVRQTIDDMNGVLDHAPLATRVAWVRDLFEQIDVDSRVEKAVAVWRAATDEGVNRSDAVYEWLRRQEPATLRLTAAGLPPHIVLRIGLVAPVESHLATEGVCRRP